MIKITNNVRDLSDSIVYLQMNCNSMDYPTEFQTYDEAWEELRQNINHLRSKLGEARYHKLVEMAVQAKAHYDEGYTKGFSRIDPGKPKGEGFDAIKRASFLMQDIEEVIKGRQSNA